MTLLKLALELIRAQYMVVCELAVHNDQIIFSLVQSDGNAARANLLFCTWIQFLGPSPSLADKSEVAVFESCYRLGAHQIRRPFASAQWYEFPDNEDGRLLLTPGFEVSAERLPRRELSATKLPLLKQV